MMGKDGGEMDSTTAAAASHSLVPVPVPVAVPTRPSLKSDSPFSNWKHQLRENCYKRVREERSRLLWRLRMNLPAFQKPQEEVRIVRSAFQDIVSDEFYKIKDDRSFKPSLTDSASDDLLWEYDGVQSCYEGEREEILLEMQRIFYEDLNSQPPSLEQGLENEIDNWEDEVDEYLARAVYEHMQLNGDKACREEIWCPICKQGELKEDNNCIYCTNCKVQLNKAAEVTLDILRHRLAEVHEEHLDRGCRLTPKFCVQSRFGLTALYISCVGCETFEVVI